MAAATTPMRKYNSESGLVSGTGISYFFADEGGLLAIFLGVIDAEHGTHEETDDTADDNTYNKFQHWDINSFLGTRGSYSVSAPGALSEAESSVTVAAATGD